MKVLVAIDGSKYSQEALEAAVKIVPKSSFFTLFNCVEPIIADPFGFENYSKAEVKELNQQMLENSSKTLSTSIQFAKNIKLNFNTTVILGKSKREIANFAKKHAYDLIVVGSRGMNPFKGLKLGSTTYSLLHYSPCSLLIYKNNQQTEVSKSLEKIVFGFCNTPDSIDACELLKRLNPQAFDHLYIVTVLKQRHIYGMEPTSTPSISKAPEEYIKTIRKHQHNLDSLLAPLMKQTEVSYELIEKADNIAFSLSSFAKENCCDLIVVGNKHAHNGSQRQVVGNIRLNLVYHSKCSILISQTKN